MNKITYIIGGGYFLRKEARHSNTCLRDFRERRSEALREVISRG